MEAPQVGATSARPRRRCPVRGVGYGPSYLFPLNHTEIPQNVDAAGHDLLSRVDDVGAVTVPADGVRVPRETA
jgi:hypothetical protein